MTTAFPGPANARPSVFGVVGELLITAGVLVMLFLAWQSWFNDIVVGAQQESAASELSRQWEQPPAPLPAPDEPAPATTGVPTPVVAAPPVTVRPEVNVPFATLIVPRLGADYNRPIAEGVGSKVLNNSRIGIGHYPTTTMPGELGNFALAAHRSAYGGGFHYLNQLVIGDEMFVATADGWYRYVYRNTEYVRASGIGVLAPVPQFPDLAPADRIITLTTCNPLYSTAERLIAYGVFAEFTPRSDGPPAAIASLVHAGAA